MNREVVGSESWKAKRKAEMLRAIAEEREEKGTKVQDLIDRYKDRYIEDTGAILTRYTVNQAINTYCSTEFAKNAKSERDAEIRKRKEDGQSVNRIAQEMNISRALVYKVLHGGQERQKQVVALGPAKPELTLDMIDRFAAGLSAGDFVRIVTKEVTDLYGLGIHTRRVNKTVKVLEKYKHHCVTDSGDYRWADLFIGYTERMGKNA